MHSIDLNTFGLLYPETILLTGIEDVEPTNDRVLLFYSDIIVHEVLPVTVVGEKRFTLTLWIPTESRYRYT